MLFYSSELKRDSATLVARGPVKGDPGGGHMTTGKEGELPWEVAPIGPT